MDIGVLHAIVELLSDDLLSVAVGEEVYRSSRDNANERSRETLEQGARGFIPVDIPLCAVSSHVLCRNSHPLYAPYDMGGLHEMPQQTRATLRHSQNPSVHPICDDIDSNMGLPEQTRLQPRLHHVEWARDDGSGHATNPGKKKARSKSGSGHWTPTTTGLTLRPQNAARTSQGPILTVRRRTLVTEAREDGFGHVIRHLFTTIGPCRGTVRAGDRLA